jgi:hypothetical protein
MPRRSEETERVGLCAIVRARSSSKFSKVAGPFTKFVMCRALSALTPGVMSMRTNLVTRSGRSLATSREVNPPSDIPTSGTARSFNCSMARATSRAWLAIAEFP